MFSPPGTGRSLCQRCVYLSRAFELVQTPKLLFCGLEGGELNIFI